MNTRLLTAIVASALLISPAFATDESSRAPLAPGKPAGVHQADLSTPTLIGLGFVAVIGLGIGLVISNEGDQKSTSTTGTP